MDSFHLQNAEARPCRRKEAETDDHSPNTFEFTRTSATRHAPNVFLDTSGSVTDDGTVDMAAAVVGVERVVFGCDSSMTAGVGKIRGADLSTQDKEKILGGNMMRLLGRRKS